MVTKSDLLTARQKIKEYLKKRFETQGIEKVHVFETEYGHIRALVGNEEFRDLNPVERQELVWSLLRKNVEAEYLVFLYGVHPMDLEEYDRQTREFREDS